MQVVKEGWSTRDGVIFRPDHNRTLSPVIDPGFYIAGYNHALAIAELSKIQLETDKHLINFSDNVSNTLLQDISSFWTKEALFKKYNFPYKRGILMYGPAGCGKSSAINLLSRQLIVKGGIMLKYRDYLGLTECVKAIRRHQPDVPLIVLMEDLDAILDYDCVTDILNLLDGVEKSVEKVVWLATTNHPERLDNNIKSRPSRFDRRLEFGYPSANTRQEYFRSLFKNEITDKDLKQWVELSHEFSFAHMKELFVSVVLLDNPLEKAAKELQAMKGEISSEEPDLDDDLDDLDMD